MIRSLRALTVVLSLASLPTVAPAQLAGLRGGSEEAPPIQGLEPPDPAAAERVITVEAVAEVRVPPSRLRVVLAVAAQAESADEANAAGRTLLAATKARLEASGVAAADIDTDFIAAFPVYAWAVERLNQKDFLAENRVGTRVQYNLHVSVPDEAAALAAVEAAAGAEGVDLLAVDYWSDELTAKQIEAQRKALAAAKAKAELLLSVFEERPQPINVWEGTRILFPHELYRSLPQAEDGARTYYDRDGLTRVPAPRPLQVYYRGLFADVDEVNPTMPGRREIEVVSTVRLYFAAPGRPTGPPAAPAPAVR
ncbi:SIMPL domain-containing protein [Alienimonas californiensis]|uniref:SIMPL domain-containing protein n=1 Tax=Alienimonas californiensis TaxID=2527989 RepID=A0A517PA21_9PLAN|nr:SIMPL domain-containing protein [Alienimonas californiensis]QDT16226.1 hypothetical protein CA12_23260 [Alienimonas californiensis]